MSLLARAAGLSPFGPIFGKELRITSRRKRTYLLRIGYLALLLLALLLAYATTGRSYGGVAAQMQRQAQLGMAFFMAFTIFSVGSMGLIGPVLTSNAISAEKLAKTLPVLLMTPITAWQIVSGKLFSRVLSALMLLGLSLPVLALCRLLGGVELEQMFAVVSIATSFCIACAAIGLFFSLFLNRSPIVILLAYLVLGVFYILTPIVLVALFDIGDGGPRGGLAGIKFLMSINPPACAAMMCEPRVGGFLGNTWIATVIVQLVFAAALVGWTSILLRRQFRNMGEKPILMPEAAVFTPVVPGQVMPPPVIAAPLASGLPPLDPSLHAGGSAPGSSSTSLNASDSATLEVPRDPGAQPPAWAQGSMPSAESIAPRPLAYAAPSSASPPVMRIRDVGDNPVLWRELRRPLFPKLWQRITASAVTLVIMGLVYAVLAEENDLEDIDVQGGFACVFFGVWWLLSAVLSATAISQEKETDTWTLLMTTPMSGRDIVWGKVLGLLRRMLWPTVLIAVHFLLFSISVIPFWSLLFVIFMIVACNSVWIATGVWISLKIKKVTFAVIANLMLAIVAYGVVPLMVLIPAELLTRRGENIAEHTAWYIPYVYLAQGFEGIRRADYVYNRGYRYGSSRYDRDAYWLPGDEYTSAPGFLAVAGGCAALHLLLAFLILQRTAANFDEIVGRAGKRRFVGVTDDDGAVLPVNAVNTAHPTAPIADVSTTPGTSSPGRVDGAIASSLPDDPDLYASFPRRVVAAAIDTIIVEFACSVVGLVWGMISVLTEPEELPDEVMNGVLRNHLAIALLVGLVVGGIYWATFESSRRRATPGKLLMGIFVADAQGRRLTFARALARHVAKIISTLPAGVGYIVMFTNRRRQTLHDQIAGAVVLRK